MGCDMGSLVEQRVFSEIQKMRADSNERLDKLIKAMQDNNAWLAELVRRMPAPVA